MYSIYFYKKQQGASLIVALIMLLLLTIIGVAAMQGTAVQEKMAGNMRDSHTAFHAGEITLNYAEKWLHYHADWPESSAYPCPASAECNVYNSETTRRDGLLTSTDASKIAEWQTNALGYGNEALKGEEPLAATDIQGVDSQPRLMVEQIEDEPWDLDPTTPGWDVHYTVTVQAAGAGTNSESVLQTLFVRDYNQ